MLIRRSKFNFSTQYISFFLPSFFHIPVEHPSHVCQLSRNSSMQPRSTIAHRVLLHERIPTSIVVHWSLRKSISASTCCRERLALAKFFCNSSNASSTGYSSITFAWTKREGGLRQGCCKTRLGPLPLARVALYLSEGPQQ